MHLNENLLTAIVKLKLNLWLTTPREPYRFNYISETDLQMAVQQDNVISITLRQVY